MHRSGTSLAAAILEQLGVYFGNDLLSPMQEVNEKGFWEHHGVVETHQQLLDALGRKWYSVTPMPPSWQDSAAAGKCRDRIRQLTVEEFSAAPLWGVKDPRICLFLPLWKEVLDELGITTRFLLVMRNPLEIMLSLARRDGLYPVHSLALTEFYLFNALSALSETAYSTSQYVDLLSDWRNCMKRVAEDFSLVWPNAVDSLGDDAGGIIDPRLRHQRVDTVPSEGLAALFSLLPSWPKIQFLKDTERTLLARFLDSSVAIWEKQHSSYVHAQKIVSTRDSQLMELQQQSNELQGILDNLEEQNTISQRTVATREKQLIELQQKLNSLGEQHSFAQKIVAERDGQLTALRQRLSQIDHHWLVRIAARIGIEVNK
jgi:hypothetical protein